MKRLLALAALGALLAVPAVALAAETHYTATLSADQEVPAPTVPGGYEGTGTASVDVNEAQTEISFEVEFSGLTGPLLMAHIHYGAAGEAGPPMFWLTDQSNMTGTPSPLSGTLTEADFVPVENGPQTFAEALAAIDAGNAYVNLHTEANQPGEIRGQLMEMPDSSTAIDGTPAAAPWALVLALLGAAVLASAVRRFATRVG